MSKPLPTKEKLRRHLKYFPKTGVFVWIKPFSPSTKVGDVAGSIRNGSHRVIRFDGDSYQATHLAWCYMTGQYPRVQVDHINGNGCDDRFKNLRLATASQNTMNRVFLKKSKSGLFGVKQESKKSWSAHLSVNGRRKYLGCFSSPQAAYRRVVDEAKSTRGDFYKRSRAFGTVSDSSKSRNPERLYFGKADWMYGCWDFKFPGSIEYIRADSNLIPKGKSTSQDKEKP